MSNLDFELDYSELLGRIKCVFKTQALFAQAMGMSLTAMNQRLNNKTDFTPREMIKACKLLSIDLCNIHMYFFCLKSK